MDIQYLEVVTDDVDAVCQVYSSIHQAAFGEAQARLGHARVAPLPNGGLLAVRAPLHESEATTVRPYWLVEDIQASLDAAVNAGAVVLHPPLEIPGVGTFAIYQLGQVHHGLWCKGNPDPARV